MKLVDLVKRIEGAGLVATLSVGKSGSLGLHGETSPPVSRASESKILFSRSKPAKLIRIGTKHASPKCWRRRLNTLTLDGVANCWRNGRKRMKRKRTAMPRLSSDAMLIVDLGEKLYSDNWQGRFRPDVRAEPALRLDDRPR
jgi:hypothetical protein